MEKEVQQRMLLNPGSRYRLSYQVRSQDLMNAEELRVAVVSPSSGRIVESVLVAGGSKDWRTEAFEFTAAEPAAFVAIQKLPRFSYEEPTRGTVWFDDFVLREVTLQ